jgi:vacuolar protein sorting-associated protein 13A/C
MSRLDLAILKAETEAEFKPITNWATLEVNRGDAQLVYIEKYLGSPIALLITLYSQAGTKIEQKSIKGSH